MITVRADVVGSLLRPRELIEAHSRLAAGEIAASRFRKIEDRAVGDAIAMQEAAGLDVVTDGEMRRQSFQSQMTAAVEGFGEFTMDAFLWGEWHNSQGTVRTARPPNLGATGKLVRKRWLSADEFTYLKNKTSRVAKITLPSPGLWANFWSPEHSRAAYPTLDRFLADVVQIMRDEVYELVRLGAGYIQIDAPHYGLMLDAKTRRFYEAQGWSLDQWLSRGIELDNAIIAGFPGVTFALHL
jgi:5-methyltetrahydropteroyltriglutamate--homocysteine methyltransferase